MTQVTLQKLTKTYPGANTPALDGLSLRVNDGELVALLGPSGCGKTTTLNLIAGLLEPSAGDIQFDGTSILSAKPEHRGAVMVFQSHLLFPHLNVADNVGFGLRMRGVSRDEISKRVADMLALVKLPDLGQRRPSELSGGQQQRVALARALIVEPKVLLLDEPLSNLDAHLRVEMRDLIRSIQRQLGITTIFVTHDQEEAVVLADRIALMLDGKLQQFDLAEKFYTQPESESVARFFGGRNFVFGQSKGGVFDCPLGQLQLPADTPDNSGTLTFRPENVRLGPARLNSLQAKLTDKIYMGTQTRLLLRIGEIDIEALANPADASNLAAGDHVEINLPPAALWLLPQNIGG